MNGAARDKAGALSAGAKFRMKDNGELSSALASVYREYLPDGVSVEAKGAKWVVADGAKAGKAVVARGTGAIDEAKSKFTDNMSGLKLTYSAKNGSFKGSFKAFALENGRFWGQTLFFFNNWYCVV